MRFGAFFEKVLPKMITSPIQSLCDLRKWGNKDNAKMELFALRRQYGDAANLLQAASQLATHFEGYSQIPKIAELQEKYRGVKNQLRAAVFDDFHTTWLPHVMDGDAAAQKKLRDACLVVNALEPSVREELVGNLTNRELTNYASVFSAHESGDFLGRIARRYEWITRQ